MNNDFSSPAFKKLLQKLQEESWQLELLISGFAIFGLFSTIGPLEVLLNETESEGLIFLTAIYLVALISCSILLFSLLLHVVLRGVWIGALGLRYVSGEIDYDYLNYSQRFTKYLKKNVGSFDRYIGRLENYCSIIFAMSFLLIFYVLAFVFTILSLFLISTFILNNDSLGDIGKWIGIPLVLFVIFGMLFVFIDFATLGWLKKKKWISRIYFPFYWLFGFITLSFLYRPLVYNFLDNKFGRRLSLTLLPIYIILIIAFTYNHKSTNYFYGEINSSAVVGNSHNYLDQLTDEKDFVENFAITSKVISKNYLGVFMALDDDIDDRVFAFDSTLRPKTDIRGFNSEIFKSDETSYDDRTRLRNAYVKTLGKVYRIKIDSTYYPCEFIFTENLKKQKGFESFIDLDDLSEGKHVISLTRKSVRKEDTLVYSEAKIPFWYFHPKN